MKPEIKRYFDAHGDDPRPAMRKALLAEGHSPDEVDAAFLEWDRGTAAAEPETRRGTFDRVAAIFHLVGLGWVAYWLPSSRTRSPRAERCRPSRSWPSCC